MNNLQLIRNSFRYLEVDFDFSVIESEESNTGLVIIYQNEFGKVGISCDYRDCEISVSLVQGKNTSFPNDEEYWKKIIPLEHLVEKNDSDQIKNMKPITYEGYSEAIRVNANLLKTYGYKILKGEEWF